MPNPTQPKLKAEAERAKWQMLFTLANQGYNALVDEFAEQLNMQIEAQPQQPQPPGNGEDRTAARP